MARIKIGVIGGGAAGMMAAITAAREGASVTLLEGGERVGKKILATGNGKCNLGNLALGVGAYNGAKEEWLEACLRQFHTDDTIQFFRGLGLLLKEKNGYLYPLSEQAASVLDVLRTELRTNGVSVVTEYKVNEIRRTDEGGFAVYCGEKSMVFDRVILACGSKAAPKTGSDGSGYKLAKRFGHALIPTVPALVQLKCEESSLKEVAGVRADARITVVQESIEGEISERGELQLTDYGISGIPVFQLSRKVNYLLRDMGKDGCVRVTIDLLPDVTSEEFAQFCIVRKLLQNDRTVEEFFTGMLHKKLMLLFIKMAGLKRDAMVSEVAEEKLQAVFALCKDWRLNVIGSNSFDNAQVCAGGVDTASVTTNMESTLIPGLFFAGELLDVDGRCGGYNLHWAWCSGYIAGRNAARLE